MNHLVLKLIKLLALHIMPTHHQSWQKNLVVLVGAGTSGVEKMTLRRRLLAICIARISRVSYISSFTFVLKNG